jgi:NTP pyrophosphatase (non-canonical NTP hydrolase)
MNLDVLENNVKQWANQKGLLVKENSAKQMLKVTEEIGEVAAAIARDDLDKLRDGIGDGFVTLIILAHQNGLTPQECLQTAWNEIKDRMGMVVAGVFIKETDLSEYVKKEDFDDN